MSTAIVSAEHINVILEAATRDADDEGFEWFAQGKWWTFTRSNRDRIGQLMLDANLDAYGRRYLEPTEVYVYSYSIPTRIHEPIEDSKRSTATSTNATLTLAGTRTRSTS